MRSAKTKNLARLARLVDVPPFEVVPREERDRWDAPSFAARVYVVRSCTLDEDGASASCAGASWTSPPVPRRAVLRALRRAFRSPAVVECIVQEHAAGASGVAFCSAPNDILLEYSAVPGGVTAGRVNPFAALLPSDAPRYRALSEALQRILAAYGPCDVELVDIEAPRFVQMRPITAEFAHDRELARLKMQLQDAPCSAWQQDDFCIDLMERRECSASWLRLFLDAVPAAYEEAMRHRPRLPAHPFLTVGQQIFAAEELRSALRLRGVRALRLGFRVPRLLAALRRELTEPTSVDPQRIQTLAIWANLLDESVGRFSAALRAELFRLREHARIALMCSLPSGA
ncbi:MAG: hypothetical protein JNM84_27995, partial [Planctomycetes bacterium]|nr:hypothetical protein [Planctomycetota bacterium]